MRLEILSVALCVVAVASAPLHQARAETLKVGSGEKYKMPSEAAAVAKDGDVVEISAGEYVDCAFWKANNLTIVGKGDARIADKSCGGKGLFVISGNNATVKNLSFSGARVPDFNGAGIRSEGVNLKIENDKFIENENGILVGVVPGSTIEISDSEFIRNGTCEGSGGCSHGIYIGHIDRVVVKNSKFFETKEGHHIKSRAARTEVINCDIRDGDRGTASYLVEVPQGGSLLLEGTTLEKGPKAGNRSAAVVIGAEGVSQPTRELTIKNNTFANDNPNETVFVRNITATAATLTGNKITGKVRALAGDGKVQ